MSINQINQFEEIKKILDRNDLRISIQNGNNCCVVLTPQIHFPVQIDPIIIHYIYKEDGIETNRFKNNILVDKTFIKCPPNTRKLITLLSFYDLCNKFGFPHQYAKFIINDKEVDKQEFYENACWQSSETENIIMKAAEGKYTNEELKNLNVFDDYQFAANLITPKTKT